MKPFEYLACLSLLSTVSLSADEQCSNISEKGHFFTLSVNRKVDQDGRDWIRTYSAQNTDSEKPSDDIVLEATHSNVECHGKNVIRLEVVVRALKNTLPSRVKADNFLSFHKIHGKNVYLVEKGLTAQKINEGDPDNAILFTNRPLRNDEIFQVKIEDRLKKWNHALGFGVVNFSPDDVELLSRMYVRNQTWIMHHTNIYHGGSMLKNNYGKDLDSLKVNDRIGVLRRENGELHFFINGVDQGSAAVVPESVYGILELWRDATRARIKLNAL